jgi:hypothetical protein
MDDPAHGIDESHMGEGPAGLLLGKFRHLCDNLARYLVGQPLQHVVPDGY